MKCKDGTKPLMEHLTVCTEDGLTDSYICKSFNQTRSFVKNVWDRPITIISDNLDKWVLIFFLGWEPDPEHISSCVG